MRAVQEWRPIPGSLDAIARLNRAGYRVVVATSQPGIRRRYFTFEVLNAIHETMHRQLGDYGGTIDAVFICLCLPSQHCDCFSPHPSMFHEIAERLHVSLAGVPYIAGTERHIEAAAAAAAGARPILVRSSKVRTGKRHSAPHDTASPDGFETCSNLTSAVDTLLAEH